MKFTEKFTTQELEDEDATGTEAKKMRISSDAYAVGLMLQSLIHELRFKK